MLDSSQSSSHHLFYCVATSGCDKLCGTSAHHRHSDPRAYGMKQFLTLEGMGANSPSPFTSQPEREDEHLGGLHTNYWGWSLSQDPWIHNYCRHTHHFNKQYWWVFEVFCLVFIARRVIVLNEVYILVKGKIRGKETFVLNLKDLNTREHYLKIKKKNTTLGWMSSNSNFQNCKCFAFWWNSFLEVKRSV